MLFDRKQLVWSLLGFARRVQPLPNPTVVRGQRATGNGHLFTGMDMEYGLWIMVISIAEDYKKVKYRIK